MSTKENKTKMNLNEAVSLLLNSEKEKDKVVLLFKDNRTRNAFSERINSAIKENPNFIINNKTRFKTSRNEVRLGDKFIYLGLASQKYLLLEHYTSDELKEYDEDDTDKRKNYPVRK